MWLIGTYMLLVVVFQAAAVGLLFVTERLLPDFSNVVFVTAIFAGLILPWFVAVRVAERWEPSASQS